MGNNNYTVNSLQTYYMTKKYLRIDTTKTTTMDDSIVNKTYTVTASKHSKSTNKPISVVPFIERVGIQSSQLKKKIPMEWKQEQKTTEVLGIWSFEIANDK